MFEELVKTVDLYAIVNQPLYKVNSILIVGDNEENNKAFFHYLLKAIAFTPPNNNTVAHFGYVTVKEHEGVFYIRPPYPDTQRTVGYCWVTKTNNDLSKRLGEYLTSRFKKSIHMLKGVERKGPRKQLASVKQKVVLVAIDSGAIPPPSTQANIKENFNEINQNPTLIVLGGTKPSSTVLKRFEQVIEVPA